MAKKERSYGLSPDEVKTLKAAYAETKKFPVPYQKGAYRFTIEALVAFGDDFNPLAKVHAAFKKAAGDDWYRAWADKEARTERGKDADGRFLQNLRVLQRTNDFGKRLLEVGKKVLRSKGAVIDLARNDAGELLVRLNLDSSKPQKAGRPPKEGSPAKPTKPRKSRPKAKKKAQKGRAKTKGPKPSDEAGIAGEQP